MTGQDRLHGPNRAVVRGRVTWLSLAIASMLLLWPLTATALGGLSAGDALVRDFILAHRVLVLDWFMLALSWIGSEYATPVLLVVLLYVTWCHGRRLALYSADRGPSPCFIRHGTARATLAATP